MSTINNIKSAFSPERQRLSTQYIGILGKVLNDLHSVNYSYRFWALLLAKYIGSVISNLEIYGSKVPDIWISSDTIPGFGKPLFKDLAKMRLLHVAKYLMSFKKKSQVFNLIKDKTSLHIGFPDLQEVNDDLGSKLPNLEMLYSFNLNAQKRSKLESLAQEYDDVVVRNMIIHTPKIFVEGFSKVLNDIPLYDPQSKIFHYHIAGNFYDWILAKYTENGSKLYWYQHGAYYGEMQNGGHVKERALADVYRTWGWKIENKDEPWKAYRLIKFKEDYHELNQENQYDLLIPMGMIPSQFQTFTNDLLTGINRDKYPKLLFRPRPTSRIFSNKHKLNFIEGPGISISTGLNLIVKDIVKSNIVIQPTIPATNFLECIVIDHPTIGILGNDQPTKIIQKYYDFFLETGVLHYKSDSLIEHLNKIQLDDWWDKVINNIEYKKFKREFASTID